MKKRILLFTAVAGLGYVTLTSYDDGAAAHGQNRSGVKSASVSCGGSSCHGTGAGTTVTIEVDSTGAVPVTSYVPGMLYTVKIHGTNVSSLPKFGFTYASVKGTGASQTQAGTASGLPSGVASHTLSGISFIEHATPLTAATAGTYDISFQWTAPAAGTGNVTMYCTLNAVNGNGNEDNADISGNTSNVLTEQVSTNAVATATSAVSLQVYPNPVSSNLNVAITAQATGAYSLRVFDLNGKVVADKEIMLNGGTGNVNLNASDWANGLYNVVLEKDGATSMVKVMKH